MALTICGVKTPQAPGRSTLLRPELMQLVPGTDAADETPKLPYLPQFYFGPFRMYSYPGRAATSSVKLSTGKGIDYDFDSCYNDD